MSVFEGRERFKPYDYPEVETRFINPIKLTYWIHEKLKFDADKHEYLTKLNDSDRNIISRILRTFADVENHVADDLWSLIGNFFPKPEFRIMGRKFAENEDRHAESYWRLNEVLGLEDVEPYSKDPVLSEKFDNLVNNSLHFDVKFDPNNVEHVRKLAFGIAVFSAFTEKVALFGQFMIMKSFSKRTVGGGAILKNIANIIDWSKKDEFIHGEGGVYLFNKIKEEKPEIWTREFKASLYYAFKEAMDIEVKMISDIFAGQSLPNLTESQVVNYMKHLANQSLVTIGLKPTFDIDAKMVEEVSWFDNDSQAMQQTDFFAQRVTEYSDGMVAFSGESVKVSAEYDKNLESRFTGNRG
jgi:ribonucleoside-diphosphate reductase beta chain